MMKILETIPVYDTPIWYIVLTVFVLIIGFIIALVNIKRCDTGRQLFLCLLPLIIGLIMFNLGIFDVINIHTYDQYRAYIPKDTPFEELENYNIVKHYEYSDMYIIKEKEIK